MPGRHDGQERDFIHASCVSCLSTQFVTAKHAYLSVVESNMADYLAQLELHRRSQNEVHMLAAEIARLVETFDMADHLL